MRERAQVSGDKHSSAKTMYICLCLTPALYGRLFGTTAIFYKKEQKRVQFSSASLTNFGLA